MGGGHSQVSLNHSQLSHVGGPKVNTLSHNVTNKLTVAGSDFGKEWQFIAIYGAPQRWEGRGRERSC